MQPTLGQSLGRDIFSRWSSRKQIEGESMLILLLEPTRQVYSKNVSIITDNNVVTKWVNQKLGAKLNVTKHVIDSSTVWV